MPQFNILIFSSIVNKNVASNVVYLKGKSKNSHTVIVYIYIYSAFLTICEELLPFAQNRY